MLNRVLTCSVIAIALIVSWSLPAGKPVRAQANQPCILFYGGERSIRVDFTEADLRNVEADVGYVLRKMDAAGARCCGKTRRISECIWACCDGRRTSTCNETLKQALKLLWGDYS
jgi:hypothetical protein